MDRIHIISTLDKGKIRTVAVGMWEATTQWKRASKEKMDVSIKCAARHKLA